MYGGNSQLPPVINRASKPDDPIQFPTSAPPRPPVSSHVNAPFPAQPPPRPTSIPGSDNRFPSTPTALPSFPSVPAKPLPTAPSTLPFGSTQNVSSPFPSVPKTPLPSAPTATPSYYSSSNTTPLSFPTLPTAPTVSPTPSYNTLPTPPSTLPSFPPTPYAQPTPSVPSPYQPTMPSPYQSTPNYPSTPTSFTSPTITPPVAAGGAAPPPVPSRALKQSSSSDIVRQGNPQPLPSSLVSSVNSLTLSSNSQLSGGSLQSSTGSLTSSGNYAMAPASPVTVSRSNTSHDWIIYPKKTLRISKTTRPDRTKYWTRTDAVEVPTAPPQTLLSFSGCYCFELLDGRLYDANYNFFPEEKPKITPQYHVEFLEYPLTGRPDEQGVGEIRLYRSDQLSSSRGNVYERILLFDQLACLFVRPGVYFFQATGPRYFLVQLTLGTSAETLQQIDDWLMRFVLLNRVNPFQEIEEDNSVHSAAAVINSGGEVIGQGLAKGSEFIGKGMRSATKLYQSKTKKHEEVPKELTPEQIRQNELAAQRLETAEKASNAFVTGSRGVKMGIAKGFGFVGRTGAQAVDGSSKMVKKTDWYQEKQNKKPPPDPNKAESNLAGAATVGKSGINAAHSVLSGLKQGTRTVAKDVRDTTVDVTEHRKGKEAAEQTKRGFNVAGKTALGGTFCMQIYTTHTFSCLIHTGVGAASYDPNKKDVLSGIAWKVGWMTKQGSYLNPWSPRFAILRTYSLAFYKTPEDSQPTSYYHIDEITSAEAVPSSVTEMEFSFNIQTKKELLYFSLDMGELESQLQIDRSSLEADVYHWINAVTALATASSVSRMCRKQLK